MTFRTRLLLISSLTIAGVVALVTGTVSILIRRSLETVDTQRRSAMIEQFRRSLNGQGEEVARKAERAITSPAILRIAAESARPDADFAPFLDEAKAQAETLGLDFVEILKPDHSIISSAHWQARYGYPNNWLISHLEPQKSAFLTRVPTPEGDAVALATIRTAGPILILAADRLDKDFLSSLSAGPGMRALLWLNENEVISAQGKVENPKLLLTLATQATTSRESVSGTIHWSNEYRDKEAFLAIPLLQDSTVLGVLFAGTSLAEQMTLERSILWTGILAATAGIILGSLMGWWTTERVTKPVTQLAKGAAAIAAGDWTARVEVTSKDEIGQLALSFNHMTIQLLEQRDRTIQAERVAAWRELARRLAHELKNPLFPLQLTIENMQRARQSHPEQFDEVFQESTTTMLHELQNLKTIIGRFSDFAKMPKPQFEQVDINEVVRHVLNLFQPQLQANGRNIKVDANLSDSSERISADPEQLGRALGNLVLNALDAMPQTGTLHITTSKTNEGARLTVSDTGQGLSAEECERLFTPYYTTKHHGTGLGLAIVQSVVSDHGGKITLTSAQGEGSTFTIDLPAKRDS